MSGSVVYLVQSGENGPIKIGTTTALERRMRALSGSSGQIIRPLRLLPGGPAHESELHARFEHLRMHGEWFAPADDLLAFAAARGPTDMDLPTICAIETPGRKKRIHGEPTRPYPINTTARERARWDALAAVRSRQTGRRVTAADVVRDAGNAACDREGIPHDP